MSLLNGRLWVLYAQQRDDSSICQTWFALMFSVGRATNTGGVGCDPGDAIPRWVRPVIRERNRIEKPECARKTPVTNRAVSTVREPHPLWRVRGERSLVLALS